jgi:DNA modification methylase
MKHRLYIGDCLDVLKSLPYSDCIFADPPDNIGLGYKSYKDDLPDEEYARLLQDWIYLFVTKADIVWVSFNTRWTFEMGRIACNLVCDYSNLEIKPCVQTFTFGQHSHRDLGNNHRPLWRFRRADALLYPDQIRVPSWRQQNGDKRADPRGRVPGDVFEFTRVVGNSKQRRRWHPTQLNEGLVERCIRMSTPDNCPSYVVDPFGGTGTTLRVCKRIGRVCTLVEIDSDYCEKIVGEHAMECVRNGGVARAGRAAHRWELKARFGEDH